jgi:hypothetical protein
MDALKYRTFGIEEKLFLGKKITTKTSSSSSSSSIIWISEDNLYSSIQYKIKHETFFQDFFYGQFGKKEIEESSRKNREEKRIYGSTCIPSSKIQ